MKNNTFSLAFLAVLLAVMTTSGCITGEFISAEAEDKKLQENVPDDSPEKEDFNYTIKVVTGDVIDEPVSSDEETQVPENDSVEIKAPVYRGSGGGSSPPPSDDDKTPDDPPSPPPEPEEFTYTVYIDASKKVRSAEFRLSFTEGTEVVGDPVVGEFLSDGSVLYVDKMSEGSILVGIVRDPDHGFSGTGELGSVTFFGFPEDVKLVHSQVIEEKINGKSKILESYEVGNTVYVD